MIAIAFDTSALDWAATLCAIALVFAVLFYSRIYFRNKAEFAKCTKRERLIALFLYDRSDKSNAFSHVAANVSLSCGLALLLGHALSQRVRTAPAATEELAMLLGVAGLTLSVLASIATFWTLWQTKRLEMQEGFRSNDFLLVVKSVSNQIQRIVHETRIRKRARKDFDRLLVIAEQPFYGMLTFQGSGDDNLFKNALQDVALLVKDYKDFEVLILCGTPAKITKWHERYYHTKGDEKGEMIQKADALVEEYISHMNKVAGTDIFVRSNHVPSTEFIIAGDMTVEFAIDTSSGKSVVEDTHIRSNPRIADRQATVFRSLVAGARAQETASKTTTPPPNVTVTPAPHMVVTPAPHMAATPPPT